MGNSVPHGVLGERSPRMHSEGLWTRACHLAWGWGGQCTPAAVKGVLWGGMEVWPTGLYPGRWMEDTAEMPS